MIFTGFAVLFVVVAFMQRSINKLEDRVKDLEQSLMKTRHQMTELKYDSKKKGK